MMRRSIFIGILVSLLLAMTGLYGAVPASQTDKQQQKNENATQERKDDWVLQPELEADQGPPKSKQAAKGLSASQRPLSRAAPSGQLVQQLGLAVGGAKDIHNFRENIANGYLPLPTDVTYAGLFYDYSFKTRLRGSCEDLFCPAYESWVSADPFSKTREHYLSVGLQSGISGADFRRDPLNLVVVLDISGSMSSPFNRYYYDRFGNRVEGRKQGREAKRKMQVAKESLAALTEQLRPSDRLGIVMFNNQAFLAKPLNPVSQTDMSAIRRHIKKDLHAGGGTNMHAGMLKGAELFKGVTSQGRESRIIFMTDAMPNLGMTEETGLGRLLAKHAQKGIHATFVGIGVDFNTRLVQALTKIRGANYYSVHNEQEFKDKLNEGFEYMVFPLAFDLRLSLKAEGYDIQKVFGSPEAEEATGELLYVNTLFPSPVSEKGIKGGIIVVKLRRTGSSKAMELRVSYEDRGGNRHSSRQRIAFSSEEPSTGLRKGVLLSRYASLLKAWTIHDRTLQQEAGRETKPERFGRRYFESEGIPVQGCDYQLGKWERKSRPLFVSSEYQKLFQVFSDYFVRESKRLQDEALQQELRLLERLTRFKGRPSDPDKQDDWQYNELPGTRQQ